MPVDITAIAAAMGNILTAIPTPTHARKPQVTAEPPPNADTLPLWFVLEQRTDLDKYRAMGRGNGALAHTVNLYLLIGSVIDGTYNVRERRLWSEPVTDAFEQDVNLGGACSALYLRRIDYGVVNFGGLDLVATTFVFGIDAQRS